MIHAKLFMQHSIYLPWLLVASLVLGWPGEAWAGPIGNIEPRLDSYFLHENGGSKDFKLTVRVGEGFEPFVTKAATEDISIALSLNSISLYPNLFMASLPIITIKKGEEEASGIITIIPFDNDWIGRTRDGNNDNLIFHRDNREYRFGWDKNEFPADSLNFSADIPIFFNMRVNHGGDYNINYKGPGVVVFDELAGHNEFGLLIVLVDDDKPSTELNLSFDPALLSGQADATSIEVTGSLNGATVGNTSLETRLFVTDASSDLVRDVDYSLTDLSKLTIPRNKISGKTTFTLDPHDTNYGEIELRPGNGTLTRVVKERTHIYMGETVKVGLDIDLDGTLDDNGVVLSFFKPQNDNRVLENRGNYASPDGIYLFGVDLNGDGDVGSDTNSNGTIEPSESDVIPEGIVLEERDLGIDFNSDSDLWDTYTVPVEGLREVGLEEVWSLEGLGYPLFISWIDFNGDGDFHDVFYSGDTLDYVTSFAYPIKANSGAITVKNVPIAKVKSFTLSPEVIHENAGATDITMTVELEKALTKAQRVDFEITPGTGTRDEHYTVQVTEGLTIAAGATKGTAMLRVTPVDNSAKNAARTFTVKAKIGDRPYATQMKDVKFTITDDETLSENITLKVSPSEIKEDAGQTTVTVMGKLDGKVLDADATISLVVDETPDKSATRDLDYTAVVSSLTIPQGEVIGETTITVTPANDGKVDNDETITLKPMADNLKNQDGNKIMVESVAITLKDAAATPTIATPPPAPATPTGPSFGADALAFEATVGRAFSTVLPEATGGQGTLTYRVSSDLPAGLSFDAVTRTISGTPPTVGASTVFYMAVDGDGTSGTKTFTITVSEAPPVTVGVASVMVSQSAMREDDETAEIRLTVTLLEAAPTDQQVRLTIVPSGSDAMASRDVDYTASLVGTIIIAAGDNMGSTTLLLSPIDNDEMDGHKYLGVRAAASGGWAQADIRISDDETTSTSVVLSVMPSEISESAAATEVQVMVALDGKPLADDATATILIDEDSQATRDTDYSALFNPTITIAAGSIAGSTSLLIDPVADAMTEGDETIRIKAMLPGLAEGSATLVLTDTDGGEEMMMPLAFVAGASIPAQAYTAGTAITPLMLPAARGGEGSITYSVSGLPAGLSFDAATRMIAGTPEAEGSMDVTYTAMAGDESASLMFTITINPMMDFADLNALFGQFNAGAGKRVPLRAGLNAAARLYLDAPTALPSVGEEFVLAVRLADFVAVRGYGLQVAYDADKLAFVRALTEQNRVWAAPQVLAEAGVLTVVAHGDVVADGEMILNLVFRPTTEIASTTLEITDNQTYDRALGFNRLALPAPVALQTRPAVFSLADNYPNPFNPTTTLQYALPQAADVALTVYNVLGQPVRTLVAERQNAGRYTVKWDATNDQGHRLSAGMYFYRLQAGGDFREVKKMLLLK